MTLLRRPATADVTPAPPRSSAVSTRLMDSAPVCASLEPDLPAAFFSTTVNLAAEALENLPTIDAVCSPRAKSAGTVQSTLMKPRASTFPSKTVTGLGESRSRPARLAKAVAHDLERVASLDGGLTEREHSGRSRCRLIGVRLVGARTVRPRRRGRQPRPRTLPLSLVMVSGRCAFAESTGGGGRDLDRLVEVADAVSGHDSVFPWLRSDL